MKTTMKITLNNQTIEITEEQRKGLLESLSKSAFVRKTRPERNEYYWYLSSSRKECNKSVYVGVVDKNAWDCGDGFSTQEEAQKELNKRIAIQKVKDYIIENDLSFEPDWENVYQEKYMYYYNYEDKEYFSIILDSSRYYSPIGYFKSKKDLQKVISNCEKELKIIFDVK